MRSDLAAAPRRCHRAATDHLHAVRMIKLILVVAAIPAVVVGAIWLAVRALRWTRKNRGDAAMLTLGEQLGEALEGWISGESSSSDVESGHGHSDHTSDHHPHHHHSGDDGSHGG